MSMCLFATELSVNILKLSFLFCPFLITLYKLVLCVLRKLTCTLAHMLSTLGLWLAHNAIFLNLHMPLLFSKVLIFSAGKLITISIMASETWI